MVRRSHIKHQLTCHEKQPSIFWKNFIATHNRHLNGRFVHRTLFFAQCCLGKSQRANQSCSQVKIRITACVNGHDITKFLQVHTQRIHKNRYSNEAKKTSRWTGTRKTQWIWIISICLAERAKRLESAQDWRQGKKKSDIWQCRFSKKTSENLRARGMLLDLSCMLLSFYDGHSLFIFTLTSLSGGRYAQNTHKQHWSQQNGCKNSTGNKAEKQRGTWSK